MYLVTIDLENIAGQFKKAHQSSLKCRYLRKVENKELKNQIDPEKTESIFFTGRRIRGNIEFSTVSFCKILYQVCFNYMVMSQRTKVNYMITYVTTPTLSLNNYVINLSLLYSV